MIKIYQNIIYNMNYILHITCAVPSSHLNHLIKIFSARPWILVRVMGSKVGHATPYISIPWTATRNRNLQWEVCNLWWTEKHLGNCCWYDCIPTFPTDQLRCCFVYLLLTTRWMCVWKNFSCSFSWREIGFLALSSPA